jgi:hypothetical protein
MSETNIFTSPSSFPGKSSQGNAQYSPPCGTTANRGDKTNVNGFWIGLDRRCSVPGSSLTRRMVLTRLTSPER